MIRAVIIDIEKSVRIELMDQLRVFSKDVKVVADAEDVKSGIEIIKKHKPDVVFLDVDLTGGNGFDILNYFNSNGNQSSTYKFVFTSEYDKYAIKAIKLSAFDYLLKPIFIDDLEKTVNKLRSVIDQKLNYLNDHPLFSKLYSYKSSPKKISLNTSERIYVYELSEIIRCESQNNYTMFYFKDDKPICVCKSIKEYENLLKDYNFERVHQSHLINMNYIKTYEKTAGGYILMDDGTAIPLAQRKKEMFLTKLKTAV